MNRESNNESYLRKAGRVAGALGIATLPIVGAACAAPQPPEQVRSIETSTPRLVPEPTVTTPPTLRPMTATEIAATYTPIPAPTHTEQPSPTATVTTKPTETPTKVPPTETPKLVEKLFLNEYEVWSGK